MHLFTVGASHFSPELMIIAIRSGLVCVEIPIHYRKRVGASKITGQFWKAFRLGLRMIAMTIRCRFKFYPRMTSTVDRDRVTLEVAAPTRMTRRA